MRDGSGGRRLRAFGSLAGNQALLRVLAGYLLFILTEYAVWIAMLVFAYQRGGTAVAGFVAVAQLVPAAIAAPLVAAAADRRSPAVLLAGGYLAQTAGMAGTAVAIAAGAPLAAYAAAIFASTAVTVTRPAQSALMPSVAATADQLTAANVVAGWLEAAAVAGAGLLAGVLISVAGAASVFAVCAGLGLVAALLVTRLRVAGLAGAGAAVAAGTGLADGAEPAEGESAEGEPAAGETATGIGAGLRLAARQPRVRLMLALMTADSVVIGALDLLVVILAISVLGRSSGWVGYLQFAFGIGALIAATMSVVLVGRRLGGPILAAALVFSGALPAGGGHPHAAAAFGAARADRPDLRRP
jgi:MFS family permease